MCLSLAVLGLHSARAFLAVAGRGHSPVAVHWLLTAGASLACGARAPGRMGFGSYDS